MKSRILISAMFIVLSATPALSQGCSMCRDNAAAAAADTQRSLRRGIVVLLVPSLGAMCGLIGLAYRHRNHFHADGEDLD